jgi:hypothetical protein
MKKLFLFAAALIYTSSIFATVKNCTVDSKSYAQSAIDGYGVPVRDGTVINIDYTQKRLNSVLINNQRTFNFKKCGLDMFTIDDSTMAENFLKYTGETNFDQFAGTLAGHCNTVDEGYIILLGDEKSYLAYMGPYEAPVSIVQMNCK